MFEIRKELFFFYRDVVQKDKSLTYNELKKRLNRMINEGIEEPEKEKNKKTFICGRTVLKVNTKENLIVWVGGKNNNWGS